MVDLSQCDPSELDQSRMAMDSRCDVPCDHFKWRQIESACSVKCGNRFKVKSFECYDERDGQSKPDSHCAHVRKPKSFNMPCVSICHTWQSYEWGSCSASCGGGTRQRRIICVNENERQVVDDAMCEASERPVESEPCNTHECATWIVGDWTTCSLPCKKSQKRRTVYCALSNGLATNASACNQAHKPIDKEACSQQECAVWQTTNWTECSATCGKGHKMRVVYCQAVNSANYLVNATNEIYSNFKYKRLKSAYLNDIVKRLEDSECDPAHKPAYVSGCESRRVCPEWKTSEWSNCSVACGKGVRTRSVFCSDKQNSIYCRAEDKPIDQEVCTMPECPKWKYENWTEVKYIIQFSSQINSEQQTTNKQAKTKNFN